MPIYEYECTSCGHVFEEWQKSYEDNDVSCPLCGSPSKRLISNTAFILKGSGWYVTDYGYKSSKNGNGKGDGKQKASSSNSAQKQTSSSTSAST